MINLILMANLAVAFLPPSSKFDDVCTPRGTDPVLCQELKDCVWNISSSACQGMPSGGSLPRHWPNACDADLAQNKETCESLAATDECYWRSDAEICTGGL